MKKWLSSFIFLTILSTKVWGGILELDDSEKLNKDHTRIFNNLKNFYEVNASHIKILKEHKFFQPETADLNACVPALRQIKLDQQSLILKDYGIKPSGLRKLKRDLKSIESYFSSDLDKNSKTIVNFARGMLLILKYFNI